MGDRPTFRREDEAGVGGVPRWRSRTSVTCASTGATLMLYDLCLEAGTPIATGVIEGTCRTLINDRLDITGARWSLKGAEAILKLRALMQSADFDAYWAFHTDREHHRNHASKYADEKPPKLALRASKPRLRLVK